MASMAANANEYLKNEKLQPALSLSAIKIFRNSPISFTSMFSADLTSHRSFSGGAFGSIK